MTTTTTDRNQKLALALGWTNHGNNYWNNPQGRMASLPPYTTDYNAMAEVWKVLKERGLWHDFMDEWHVRPGGRRSDADWTWQFLNDLPGQVEAAIAVLRIDRDNKRRTYEGGIMGTPPYDHGEGDDG